MGETTGVSRSRAEGTTVSESIATTTGRSIGRTVGKSVGTTITTAETEGTSISAGLSEGLEPIYQVLPTAVHSIENVRYLAAQMLRRLSTGEAFVNLVTRTGMLATRLSVPEVKGRMLSKDELADLRRRVLEGSSSAIPIGEAVANVAERERRLIAEARQLAELSWEPEPTTFRVPVGRRTRDVIRQSRTTKEK